MRKNILIGIMTACACAGAEGRLDGPGGLVFDSASASVRSMYGVPGSAYLGAAVAEEISAAAVAPNGRAALYLRDGSLVLQKETAAVLAEGLAGARIAWSADSSSAAVADGSGAVRIFKLDGSAARTIADAPAGIADLALDGELVIASAAGGIYVLEAGKPARLLTQTEGAADLALLGADLFYADRSRGEVRVLRSYAGGGDPALVAKLDGVVGVGVAKNVVVIASASQKRAIGLRIGSNEPVFDLELDFEPSSVDAFGDAAWLLNAGQSGPLQVLVADASPAVYFIPRQ